MGIYLFIGKDCVRVEGRYRNGNIFVDWEGLSEGGREI